MGGVKYILTYNKPQPITLKTYMFMHASVYIYVYVYINRESEERERERERERMDGKRLRENKEIQI